MACAEKARPTKHARAARLHAGVHEREERQIGVGALVGAVLPALARGYRVGSGEPRTTLRSRTHYAGSTQPCAIAVSLAPRAGFVACPDSHAAFFA